MMMMKGHALLLSLAAVMVSALAANPATAQPINLSVLRAARSHVGTVKMHVERLEYYLAEWKGLGSQISDSRIAKFNESTEEVTAAHGKALEELGKLPAEHADVAALTTELNALTERYNKALADAKAMLEGAHEAVESVGGREAIQADLDRLSEIANQFSYYANVILTDSGRALELLKEYRPAVDEIAGFETKYAEFLKNDNADTYPVKRRLTDARHTMGRVVSASNDNVGALRDMASRNLDEAEQLVHDGVSERKTAYFGPEGGVKQRIDAARAQILLAREIDAEGAAALVERYKAVNASAAAAGKTLRKDIIAANKGPRDIYRGADRDALVAAVKSAWLAANPGDRVVQVRMPVEQWKRVTKWYFDSGTTTWYYVDRSELQAAVIIEAKGEEGQDEWHSYPVDIVKDHQSGDQLRYSPWKKEKLEDLWVNSRMHPGAGPG